MNSAFHLWIAKEQQQGTECGLPLLDQEKGNSSDENKRRNLDSLAAGSLPERSLPACPGSNPDPAT